MLVYVIPLSLELVKCPDKLYYLIVVKIPQDLPVKEAEFQEASPDNTWGGAFGALPFRGLRRVSLRDLNFIKIMPLRSAFRAMA